MQPASKIVTPFLHDALPILLGWQRFHGTTAEYTQVRNRVLDDQGQPRPEMIGPLGYMNYADTYQNQKMQPAHINVSDVLSRAEFDTLGWQGFQGTTAEYAQV